MRDPLAAFSPATRAWFQEALGRPTPPQIEGWPAIQRGEHTLILAPTGSGKTLAAFLWGIDTLYQRQEAQEDPSGIGLLYISPLKALNNDIERNLRAPLEGIRTIAARQGTKRSALRVAVRTGDTPASQRAQMLKHPPDILITTPESLYLMLTSPKARDLFRTVRGVIVDEIHTLCGNKRGAHLALSLERLTHLAEGPVQRIGLSATIRPLEEAARFLGGQVAGNDGPTPRPVTIVDAHYQKDLKLEVITAVEDFNDLPGGSIWPAVVPLVLADILRHRTTLIFANNRRLAERTADRLNAQLAAERSEEIEPGSTAALAPGGLMRDRGMFAIGAEGPIRAHHGSMSKEARREMEADLKAGKLPALVGTSSLELGIDIGAVDLVVQLQSPKSVSQGLQRVGRSGHLVGQTSHGRIYATFREDLMEAAAITRGMLDGDVELTHTPESPLDVLAQQIVAMVAMESWRTTELFDLIRGAYPYRSLSQTQFESVLDMLTGRFFFDAAQVPATASLRAKLAWDRTGDRLIALPGTRLLAMSNVGTIPDTGAFGVYLGDGKTRIGELDEEFVFETRIGDTFLLGSNVWRVAEINDDRVVVTDAAGATPRMPFWNGDYPYRPYELGARIGAFRREIAERLARPTQDAVMETETWLRRDYALDDRSARALIAHVRSQLSAVGVLSSDRTIVVETFRNDAGDLCLVVQSPFGGRVNGAWALALLAVLRERIGVTPEAQTNDDGILFRLPGLTGGVPVEVGTALSADEARRLILNELPDSAVFGAQFRMNAGRALLLPRMRGMKRMPFWLQRLRARDLLALVRRFDNFPIVAETTRDCLRDVFDMPHLADVLNSIQSGAIQVVNIESQTPSPIATGLLHNFVSIFMYEWDAPKAERQLQALSAAPLASEAAPLDADWTGRLRPAAIAEVVARAGHTGDGARARTKEELALILRELGDLTEAEVLARCTGDGAAWRAELAAEGRIGAVSIGGQARWVSNELTSTYETRPDVAAVLARHLRWCGPISGAELLARYPFAALELAEVLAGRVERRELVRGYFTDLATLQICDAHLLDQMQRRTLAQLRNEIRPVSLPAYANFLARWQHAHPRTRLEGGDGLRKVLEQLRGLALAPALWEREVLATRVVDYAPTLLDALGRDGAMIWDAVPSPDAPTDLRRARVRFFFRGEGRRFLEPARVEGLDPQAQAVFDFLKEEGASFASDLQAGLGLTTGALTAALTELVCAGLVTHDAFATLRNLIAIEPESERGPQLGRGPLPKSALEQELASRLGERPPIMNRYREARRKIGQRVREHMIQVKAAAVTPAGRWSILHRTGVLGPEASLDGLSELWARVLLARYGIVTRDCLERETGAWEWAGLYRVLNRLEMRGDVRRGYFVAGLSGAQFALPEAVERLREAPDEEVVILGAADPANIYGGGADGTPRFSRIATTHLALVRGRPVVIFEDSARRITVAADVDDYAIERAWRAYLKRPGVPGRITVAEWNGAEIIGSPGQAILKDFGFQKTPTAMEWRTPH
ncbi:MAG: DEAD/DEAH box helicase [Anaerolineales bacterium]|nr:DEAD/DEAH box helicase [Anaerolineales bacterium]